MYVGIVDIYTWCRLAWKMWAEVKKQTEHFGTSSALEFIAVGRTAPTSGGDRGRNETSDMTSLAKHHILSSP